LNGPRQVGCDLICNPRSSCRSLWLTLWRHFHHNEMRNHKTSPLGPKAGSGLKSFAHEVRGFSGRTRGCQAGYAAGTAPILRRRESHEFRMTLLWLLCVSLVLGGMFLHREFRKAAGDFCGVRILARSLQLRCARSSLSPLWENILPPPWVGTRAGPGPLPLLAG
jgi:hypothetical protein